MVSRLRALMAVLVAFGCAESPVQPAIPVDDFELPEPDLSLDPERIRTGDILATECAFGIRGDRLVDFRDVYEWRTVDIFLPPGTATRPTPADLERFEKYGVRVLHTFNLRAVRGRVVVAGHPRARSRSPRRDRGERRTGPSTIRRALRHGGIRGSAPGLPLRCIP